MWIVFMRRESDARGCRYSRKDIVNKKENITKICGAAFHLVSVEYIKFFQVIWSIVEVSEKKIRKNAVSRRAPSSSEWAYKGVWIFYF